MGELGTEFKVGLFTLLGLVATIISIFVLSPELFDGNDKKTYYTILADASGILEKTHVKTNGVNIGRVRTIELSDRATKVTMEIRKDVLIPEGSKIVVRTVGFLGDKFIEIIRPRDVEAPIESGGFIPRSKDSSDLQEVISLLGSIGKDIKKVTENLSAVLGEERGRRSIDRIVSNIEQFSEDAKGILAENRDNVRDLVSNLKDFSETMKDVMNDENRQRLDRILTNFDSSMQEVEGATKNIKLISDRIERGEGTIGKLVNEDDALVELEGAIKDIREVLAPVNKLEIGVETRAEIRRNDTSQTYFNLTFQTRPDYYYLIGFTDLDERVRRTQTETIDQDPNDNVTTIREQIEDDRALRFNLQFAKRWQWFGARLGLFESTGGVAADMYFFDDRLRVSLEAFDFSQSADVRRTAHLKAYASALFFNHIYAMVGVDDPTRIDPQTGEVDKELNYYGGAGLTFTDQDLKTLFGMAAIAAGSN
jgi:phospholipid/cholesterol/gamma-HCH transport system substrate-binding protein